MNFRAGDQVATSNERINKTDTDIGNRAIRRCAIHWQTLRPVSGRVAVGWMRCVTFSRA